MAATPDDAQAVLAFWREAGPKKWFAKDAAFDVAFRDRFPLLYSKASRGELGHWRATPEGALAEILLLDQYPRNAFRDTPWAFSTASSSAQIGWCRRAYSASAPAFTLITNEFRIMVAWEDRIRPSSAWPSSGPPAPARVPPRRPPVL